MILSELPTAAIGGQPVIKKGPAKKFTDSGKYSLQG
jgi:hypothetical protein